MVLITRKMDENISLNNKYMIYLNESFLIHVLLITVCLRTYYTIIYYYYQCVDTSAGGLLVPGCIIIPVVSVSITGSIPLLVDYQSLAVSSVQQSVFLSLGRYLCWWTISPWVYHQSSSQCFYHWSIHLLVDYQSLGVSSVQQSVFQDLYCLSNMSVTDIYSSLIM